MSRTGVEWLYSGIAAAVAVIAVLWFIRKRSGVYRKELPRIYELHDLGPTPAPPEFYFRNLDQSLAEIPQKLKQFRDIERDLQGLDPAAWAFLKSELAPLLMVRGPVRKWEPLLNKLNQAKAYNHLVRCGYSHVAFIPPSSVKGKKTPDLAASGATGKALCEVKTINVSDIEAERREAGGAATVEDQLNMFFLKKLGSTLRQAKTQIDAYDPNSECKKIVYVVINYDDSLHEYGGPNRMQIDQYLELDHPVPGLDVELDIKEPFYTAMS